MKTRTFTLLFFIVCFLSQPLMASSSTFAPGKPLRLLKEVFLVYHDGIDMFMLREPGRDQYPSLEAFSKGDYSPSHYSGTIVKVLPRGTFLQIERVSHFDKDAFLILAMKKGKMAPLKIVADSVLKQALDETREDFFDGEDILGEVR